MSFGVGKWLLSSRQGHAGLTTCLLATNSLPVSETLCEHIHGELDESDTVHAVNSQVGGTDTDADDVQTGENALRTVEKRLGDATTVGTRRIVERDAPAGDFSRRPRCRRRPAGGEPPRAE